MTLPTHACIAAALAAGLLASPVRADPIAHPVASFKGLDKISANVTQFDVYIDETVQFGSLQITPRACYTNPPDEIQRTAAFVEVDQVSLQGQARRVFTGWMFADSPALNSVDNPVYDFWLIDCKTSSPVPPPKAADLNQPEAGG
jgi:hypothetical protein